MLNQPKQNNVLSQYSQIVNMLSGKDPDEMFSKLMSDNPQFKAFVEKNKGKSPKQIAEENGIDISILNSMRKL